MNFEDFYGPVRSELISKAKARYKIDRSSLEDIYQNCMIELFGKNGEYNKSYVQMMFFNRCKNHIDKSKAEAEVIVPQTRDFLNRVFKKAANDQSLAAMKMLLDISADRELLLLRYIQKKSYAEIENELGLSYECIRKRLYLARSEAKEHLENFKALLEELDGGI